MIEYLKTIFGNNVNSINFTYPRETPIYIKDGYTAQMLEINSIRFVLLTPISQVPVLPTLKKHFVNFQRICSYPCVLSLIHLTALQRRNLIENAVPFISEGTQVYLPFMGCCFTERFRQLTENADKMAPGTQLVFLYIYYTYGTKNLNLTTLSNKLNISKATCTRAIADLSSSGLIKIDNEGTNKWITTPYSKQEMLRLAYCRLKTPVERQVYVSDKIPELFKIKSGIYALSEKTMIAVNKSEISYAVANSDVSKIPQEKITGKQDFLDFGGYTLDIWSYDPSLLTDELIDDISLILSLDAVSDERIQMSLDEIRKQHGLI